MSPDSKIALVTGASGGMGSAFAHHLADRGYDLVLVARNRARLDSLAADIAGRTSRHAEVLAGDLTKDADLARVEERLRTDAGIEVLVNNAGGGMFGPLAETDLAAAEELIRLNVTAFTRLAVAATAAFSARDKGIMLNVSSALAVGVLPVSAVYSGTKGYVLSFTQALQEELAGTGVRVQTFLPGATHTSFWDGSGVELTDFPSEAIMSVDDAVNAAFAGLDAGESITIPSLPDDEWAALEETLRTAGPHFSRARPATRYAS
ncbi:SDR family NAD(P)-dependent oxidoreductase [Streptomyces sp. NPDC058653]|uniref:SDR family NAD(P)-dependent oxidoreductase n=1 Tax=Streptomyces sp. NPDC058653 TaxID=3346576 RepID=UPI00366746EA